MGKISLSNNRGRALEYAVTDELLKKTNSNLAHKSFSSHSRDLNHFEKLKPTYKLRFRNAASLFAEWFTKKYDFQEPVIKKLDDFSGTKGNVSDISIDNINISIKHNHLALKHQRPGALPQQCGYKKGSEEDIVYRKKYKSITQNFLLKSSTRFPNFLTFKEVKETDPTFIEDNLYEPVCNLVSGFIENNCSQNQEKTDHLFRFLVGRTDFLKLIVTKNNIQILDFSSIKSPKSLFCKTRNKSYIDLHFENEWKVSMRLHTASSRLKTVSLKFDTQPLDIGIEPIYLQQL